MRWDLLLKNAQEDLMDAIDNMLGGYEPCGYSSQDCWAKNKLSMKDCGYLISKIRNIIALSKYNDE